MANITVEEMTLRQLDFTLLAADVPDGFTADHFVTWATREMNHMLSECEEYGDLQCEQHYSPYETDTQCEAKLIFLSELQAIARP